ncbi:hypothetical protein BJ912DRAFT_920299 [Pholiota molesta]|nr:hypothetical protein BJ912DRAFT_920299 [Pholiota molesta]
MAIITSVDTRGATITKLPEPLGADNWMSWKTRILSALQTCRVLGYVQGTRSDPEENSSKRRIRSQDFIGVLIEEYRRRQERSQQEQANQAVSTGKNRKLANRIGGVAHDHSNEAACKQCGRTNHNTIDCKFLGQEKCAKCRLFGHGSAECRRDKKSGAKSSAPPTKKRKLGQANQVEGRNPQDDEESDEGAVAFNLESYDACNSYAMDERVIYYDWLADSANPFKML